jgi:hypothetical protein
MTQLYICPAHPANLNISIVNKFSFNNGDTEYAWAFQSGHKGKWGGMKVGDICLFGKKNSYNYVAIVKQKIDLSKQDNWPFKSPSGNPWSLGFYLSTPVKINSISSAEIRHTSGLNFWMTATKIKQEKVSDMRDLITNKMNI